VVGRVETIATKTKKKCGLPYLFLFKDHQRTKWMRWGGGVLPPTWLFCFGLMERMRSPRYSRSCSAETTYEFV
jgi:hypothetical protein